MAPFNFYRQADYLQFIERLNRLKADDAARWGKMNAVQMLQHLNLAIGGGLGFYTLKDTSNIITRTLAKYYLLRIQKGFIKNMYTPPSLRVKTNDIEFENERTKMKEILQKAFNTTQNSDWDAHPILGKMTREEWGILVAIHLDHHFRQFGI